MCKDSDDPLISEMQTVGVLIPDGGTESAKLRLLLRMVFFSSLIGYCTFTGDGDLIGKGVPSFGTRLSSVFVSGCTFSLSDRTSLRIIFLIYSAGISTVESNCMLRITALLLAMMVTSNFLLSLEHLS